MDLTIKNLTQEQIDAITKIVGQKKEWPQRGDEYFRAYLDGESRLAVSEVWEDSEYDRGFLAVGNCFPSLQEAQHHYDWLVARATLLRKVKMLNQGWLPNWGDYKDGEKYFVEYDHDESVFEAHYVYRFQAQPPGMYLKSKELAKQLIKENEAELKIYLGVK